MPRDPKSVALDRILEAKSGNADSLDLTGLGLSQNQLSELSAEIAKLTQLKKLDLRNNQLSELPAEIGQLTKLTYLDLSRNQLSELPPKIGQLTKLTHLYLNQNQLNELPAEIGQLTKLTYLSLSLNQLSELPAEIGQLTKLTYLSLNQNQLSELPAEIAQLTKLQTLDLSQNQLSELPVEIGQLTKLMKLMLHENEGLELPPEILGPTVLWWNNARPAEILDFYFRSRQEPSRALLEAKVLVVGQGDVGKTSLVRRLVDDTFDAEEQRTKGIDIARWHVETERDSGVHTVRLNVWDFGGQEIMHATHQFFLTKRSLYLLVLDARKGENESNLSYWLRLIQSFAADSPVLVVVNKAEGSNQLSLDERRLRMDHPMIRGFLKTSCRTGEGIGELKLAIAQTIQALGHVYDMVPASFFAVKEALEQRTREHDVLEVEDYENLCVDNEIDQRSDQELLLRFLHDLGSVLHFKDPDSPYSLEDTHVLNPQWVTRGVYKILNESDFMRAGGKIKLSQLVRVLKAEDGYPKKRRLFIIGMMRKFELCFEFHGDKALLVPELLPANEPDLGWELEEALRFEYHYTLLPDGIMPRFIVRTQAHLTDKPTYWRKGVLLEIEGNRALVRGDTQAGRVYIAVRGAPGGRRRALSVVRAQFREIHRSVPGIDPKGKVPLPHDPGEVADYAHLRRLENAGIHEYLFEGAKKPYSIRELLDGIEARAEWQPRESRPEGRHQLQARRKSSQPEVFFSYAWGGRSEEIAEEVEAALAKLPLELRRDKHDVHFKASIRGFMERLGGSRAVVVVITDRYLKSKFCMFELVAIFEAGDFRQRVFPVVAEDAKIHDAETLIDYLFYWEEKRDKLDRKLSKLKGRAHVDKLLADLSLYDKIRDLLAHLADHLRDMNTLSAREHRENRFAELTRAVTAELKLG